MVCFCLRHHQGPLGRTLVEHVGDVSFRTQRSFCGYGVVEKDVLLPVQDTGKIGIGIHPHFGQEFEHAGNGKAGDHFEVLLKTVLKFIKTRADTQGIQDHVLPGIVFFYRAEGFADGFQV